MKLNKFKLACVVFGMACYVLEANAATPGTGFQSPESVLSYQGNFFVSNVGAKLEPTKEDGDGFISLADVNGNIKEKKYFKVVLNAPKGMGIHAGVLYVTDINRIVGLDIVSHKKVFELSLKPRGVGFLNDIAISDKGILYASATDTGDIFQVDLTQRAGARRAKRLQIGKLPGPNGLAYDAKNYSLWVASFGAGEKKKGELGRIDLASLSYSKVKSVSGMLDGLALIDSNTVMVSDWVEFKKSGRILEVDVNTGNQRVLYDHIGGPADFAYLSESKQIVIPKMMESVVGVESVR